ncbi:hypothetical protein Golob_026552, partial [Gossypium lobatum]|nr:hypothetical protein [Gossypium lobatum]
AIYKGLTLAWKKGFCKVVTESDNALLIDIIVSDYAANNNLSELCLIHDICNQDWQLKFRHVLREQNRLADCMAKVVLSELNRLLAFENPPDHVRSLFEEDAHRAIVNIDSHQPYSS